MSTDRKTSIDNLLAEMGHPYHSDASLRNVWNRFPDIREEFVDFDNFKTYCRHLATGQIKTMGGGVKTSRQPAPAENVSLG